MTEAAPAVGTGPGPGRRAARGPARGNDYAELCRLVRRDGLLDRRPRYYAVKMTIMALLLAAGLAAFVWAGDSWWQLLVAVYLAAVFGQTGFLGHEAGHRQIFRSRRANDVAGLACGNLLIGMSCGGPLVESLLGGLNYQIEHHLFPSMPRPSLRRCRLVVRAFCAQQGLPYCEENLAGSYGDILRYLHATGRGSLPATAD
jgi:fatty acid desaturase